MLTTPFTTYYIALGVSLGAGLLVTFVHAWFVHRNAKLLPHILKYGPPRLPCLWLTVSG